MNNSNNNQNKLVEKSEREKEYLENTLCTFIFSIIGIIIPVFLFSVVSLHYARKHPYEKYKKLHSIGEKLAYVGIVLSGLMIIIIAIINRIG